MNIKHLANVYYSCLQFLCCWKCNLGALFCPIAIFWAEISRNINMASDRVLYNKMHTFLSYISSIHHLSKHQELWIFGYKEGLTKETS